METRAKRFSYKKLFVGIAYVLVLSLALSFGSLLGWAGKSEVISEMTKIVVKDEKPKEVFNRNSVTILILGIDQVITVNKWKAKVKTNEGGRSDMMLVARIDFDNNSVGAISIPRDTLAAPTGYRRQKINAFHAIGGPPLAEKAVEKLLPGVKIDRTMVLDFDAFQDIIDILGGVDMYVPKDMKWTDTWADLYIDLKKGRQHLDGYEAMGFARFRHTDSDFERQKRQKELMLAIKEKMVENFTMVPEIADQSLKVAGNSFTAREMASLLLFMKSLENDSITMGQVPVVDVPGTTELEVDHYNLEDALAQYKVVPATYSFARYR